MKTTAREERGKLVARVVPITRRIEDFLYMGPVISIRLYFSHDQDDRRRARAIGSQSKAPLAERQRYTTTSLDLTVLILQDLRVHHTLLACQEKFLTLLGAYSPRCVASLLPSPANFARSYAWPSYPVPLDDSALLVGASRVLRPWPHSSGHRIRCSPVFLEHLMRNIIAQPPALRSLLSIVA